MRWAEWLDLLAIREQVQDSSLEKRNQENPRQNYSEKNVTFAVIPLGINPLIKRQILDQVLALSAMFYQFQMLPSNLSKGETVSKLPSY